MSPIPKRSPFREGDRVVLHGWPGAPSGPRRVGFVGAVVGYGGSTILDVRTDDGQVVSEHWGALEPEQHDIAKATDGYRCTCHDAPVRAKSRDEVLVEIAQRIVGGHHHLLAAYQGGKAREQAQRDITSSCHHSGGADHTVQVKGKNVEFDWYGVEGKVKIVELLQIAASHGTPAKVNRLRYFARAWVAAHQAREKFVGPGGVTAEKQASPEYVALDEAGQRAYREMLRARDAWWDVENETADDLWWAGLDALRYAVIPADVPAALAFYSFVVSDEHRALAALRRAELRAAEETAA